MVAGALLTNGLPLWSGNIIFFNVPEVILCVAVFGILVGLVNGAVITRFGVAPLSAPRYDVRRSWLCPRCLMTAALIPISTAWKRWQHGFRHSGFWHVLGIYLPIWLMIGYLILGYWITTKNAARSLYLCHWWQ